MTKGVDIKKTNDFRGGGVVRDDLGISFCRYIAMNFIVACHVLQYYDNELAWWFNCGVQIFICISGFLYGQRRIDNCGKQPDPQGFYCGPCSETGRLL